MKKILRRLSAAVLSMALLVTPSLALTVEQALELLEQTYVEDLPAEAYRAETLDGLFEILGDPYTEYMTAEEYQQFMGSMEGGGSVVGIGAYIQFTEEGILIEGVIDGGGAKSVGLARGDVVIAVDGVSCVPASAIHQALILGEENTFVTLTVRHANGMVRDYMVQRRAVEIPNTTVEVLDGHIGYVNCDSFGEETGNYFLRGVLQNDWQADVWLVDLRDNSGGWTQSAVDGVGAFAGSGDHLIYRNRSDLIAESYHGAASTRDRVVMLLNGYSASASELMAAGLRERAGAVSVGTRTYGKGVAQVILDEDVLAGYFDGDALKVTSYHFYSPLGNTNDKLGVIPTLLVDDFLSEGVALYLCGSEANAPEDCLRLELNGQYYYVDLTEALVIVFQALLEALPPDVPLWLGESGVWVETSVEALTEMYGLTIDSRWFDDVADSPYADAINALGTYGILNGMEGDTFQPQGQLTRAQMCALLYQALGYPPVTRVHFSDVHPDSWYGPAVNSMVGLGLIEGMGDGTFDPHGTLTQEQFIAIMGRLAAYLNCHVDLYGEGLDAAALALDPAASRYADWARKGVMLLSRSTYEIFTEGSNMLYADPADIDPQGGVLREQAAATLYSILTTLGVLSY